MHVCEISVLNVPSLSNNCVNVYGVIDVTQVVNTCFNVDDELGKWDVFVGHYWVHRTSKAKSFRVNKLGTLEL